MNVSGIPKSDLINRLRANEASLLAEGARDEAATVAEDRVLLSGHKGSSLSDIHERATRVSRGRPLHYYAPLLSLGALAGWAVASLTLRGTFGEGLAESLGRFEPAGVQALGALAGQTLACIPAVAAGKAIERRIDNATRTQAACVRGQNLLNQEPQVDSMIPPSLEERLAVNLKQWKGEGLGEELSFFDLHDRARSEENPSLLDLLEKVAAEAHLADLADEFQGPEGPSEVTVNAEEDGVEIGDFFLSRDR